MGGSSAWSPGKLVGGRYRLETFLGSGAAAEVWRAVDGVLRAPVALKLLHAKHVQSDVAKRFLREARTAAQLRSVHVVQILDHGTDAGGTPYIALELLEGETLADRLDRMTRLPGDDVVRIVSQIAKALSKAHAAGIVHRDLKPTNVFLVRGDDADEEIAKVLDFGLAKITQRRDDGAPATTTTAIGTILGTPDYMSPEQVRAEPVDHRTDLYALGILALECLTGHVPFMTDDIVEVLETVATGQLMKPSEIARVPPGFDAWFARATALDRDARFATAKDMADTLREIVTGGADSRR